MLRLVDRSPRVNALNVVEGFQPPPRFAHARLANYIPNPEEPTQSIARDVIGRFSLGAPPAKRKLFGRTAPALGQGIYLDGGFGVGKTHLLASLWHEHPGKRAFASFVEYTNLVGAVGFERSVELLATYDLICIDEFELDDPGDTVLMATLLQRLVERGVRLAATSNTLPDKLGQGRFAADDFLREIQGLAAHFNTVRIDGPDYRHRDAIEAARPLQFAELMAVAEGEHVSLDAFEDLDAHLSQVHPSAYGQMIDGFDRVAISDLETITHQANALRWVVLVDRLYDRQIPVSYSGVSAMHLFTPEMLRGGYRKKYLRCLSRLSALTREDIV